MPIPRDQLKSPAASDPALEERILDFLRTAPREAFNLMEILAALEGYGDVNAAADALLTMGTMHEAELIKRYRDALGFLILEDQVEAGEYQGMGYYGAATP